MNRALNRPVTADDKEFMFKELSDLGRFTGVKTCYNVGFIPEFKV